MLLSHQIDETVCMLVIGKTMDHFREQIVDMGEEKEI